MNYYLLTHEHRHGTSSILFRSEKGPFDIPSEKELIKRFDIDFEPDREEYINVDTMTMEDID